MHVFYEKSREIDFSKGFICTGICQSAFADGFPKEIAIMRKLRLKTEGEGFYHVGTRCVGRAMMFNDADKTHIVDQILRMAEFYPSGHFELDSGYENGK